MPRPSVPQATSGSTHRFRRRARARLEGKRGGAWWGGLPRHSPVCLQTAYTIPIMAFAFVCHPEVLPIYTELKE